MGWTWDSIELPSDAGLREKLAGVELRIGDAERGIAEHTEKIAKADGIDIGFDSKGMFACVRVVCESGAILFLYTDGAVHDDDDRRIGSHQLSSADGEVVSE